MIIKARLMRLLNSIRTPITSVLLLGTAALLVVSFGTGYETAEESPAVTTSPTSGDNMSSFQSTALSDGVVSDDEVRTALEKTMQCVSLQGFEAELVNFNPNRGWHYQVNSPNKALAEIAGEALESCRATHADAVVSEYVSERLDRQ